MPSIGGNAELGHLVQVHLHAYPGDVHDFVEGEVGLHVLQHRGDNARQAQHADALHLPGDGHQHVALAVGAGVVGIALADAGVGQHLLAVQKHVITGGHGVGYVFAGAVLRAHAGGVQPADRAAFGGGDVQLDAAQGVHDLHQALHVYQRVLLNVQAKVFVDRADGQLRAAVHAGRVQLLPAVAGNLDPDIAHDRGQLDLVGPGIDGQHDHRVRAQVFGVAPGVSTQQQYVQPVFGEALGDGEVSDVHMLLHHDLLFLFVIAVHHVLHAVVRVLGLVRDDGVLLLLGHANEVAQQVAHHVRVLLLRQRAQCAAQQKAQRQQRGDQLIYLFFHCHYPPCR